MHYKYDEISYSMQVGRIAQLLVENRVSGDWSLPADAKFIR